MLASYRTLLSDLTSFFFLFHTNMACHNFAVGSFQIRGLLGVFFLTVTFPKKKKMFISMLWKKKIGNTAKLIIRLCLQEME